MKRIAIVMISIMMVLMLSTFASVGDFTDNHADGNGGAIYFEGDSPLVDSGFTDSHASGNGGAIYVG